VFFREEDVENADESQNVLVGFGADWGFDHASHSGLTTPATASGPAVAFRI